MKVVTLFLVLLCTQVQAAILNKISIQEPFNDVKNFKLNGTGLSLINGRLSDGGAGYISMPMANRNINWSSFQINLDVAFNDVAIGCRFATLNDAFVLENTKTNFVVRYFSGGVWNTISIPTFFQKSAANYNVGMRVNDGKLDVLSNGLVIKSLVLANGLTSTQPNIYFAGTPWNANLAGSIDNISLLTNDPTLDDSVIYSESFSAPGAYTLTGTGTTLANGKLTSTGAAYITLPLNGKLDGVGDFEVKTVMSFNDVINTLRINYWTSNFYLDVSNYDLRAVIFTGGKTTIVTAYDVIREVGRLYSIAVRFSKGEATLFVDGVEVASGLYPGTFPGKNDFYIIGTPWNSKLSGSIDDFSIINLVDNSTTGGTTTGGTTTSGTTTGGTTTGGTTTGGTTTGGTTTGGTTTGGTTTGGTTTGGTTTGGTTTGGTVSPVLVITAQSPENQYLYPQSRVTLSATVSGDSPITYQWYKNGLAITGATKSTYILPSLTASDAGDYHVRASAPSGYIDSKKMNVIFGEPPSFTNYITPTAVQVGQTLTLSVTAAHVNPTQVISYQWYFNGKVLYQKISPTLSLPNVTTAQAGNYKVKISVPNYSITGHDVNVTVVAANAPGIKSIIGRRNYRVGETITLKMDHLPATGVTYQWYKNGFQIPGATAQTLNVAAAQTSHSGNYVGYAINATGTQAKTVMVNVMAAPSARLTANELALIINDQDPYSVEIGEYYRIKRSIPLANIVHVSIPVAPMKRAEFATLRTQILSKLSSNIQAIAVAWKVPYTVECNSFTSALSRGFDPQPCDNTLQKYPTCSYGTLPSFTYHNSTSNKPFTTHGFRPSMLLAANTVAEAKAMIDRGVASDRTRPVGSAYIVKTTDNTRSLRANNVSFDPSNPLGIIDSPYITNKLVVADTLYNRTDLMFYFTGKAMIYNLDKVKFPPGAVADHLTSFGGLMSGSGQMSILEFIKHGATGSFGTVSEPCAIAAKFPNPSVMIQRYTQGDTLIEAYWKSLQITFQGNFIGEPLAAPYR